jgi:hypothetical protein
MPIDSMWSILVNLSVPDAFYMDIFLLEEPPYLCLPTCVSIFIFRFVLFRSCPIAWLTVQCSMLPVVVWVCILEFDYLYKSFVDTKSFF